VSRERFPRRSESVAAGTFLTRESDILVGRELLSGLSGKLSGEVVLVGNDRDGVMNGVAGTVAGELAAFTQGEKKLVLLPLVKAQELVRMPGLATEIAVAVVDLALLDETAETLRLVLGPDYEVHTWRQVAAFATEVVDTQNAALDAVIIIFLIVILFGLANALLTSVFERVREIGTMMAVGTTRRQVLTLFVLESTLLGFFGGLVGVTAGALVVALLGINGVHLTTPGASLPQLLVPEIGTAFLARMIVLSTVGAAFTALWPAWKASRLRPVEALASL
jgi:putative ABC transport system permease protein